MMWIYKKKLTCLKRHWNETKNIYKSKTMGSCANCAFARKTYTTLDYIPYIFDSFMELHGDRNFRDDPAMIGGIGF